MSAAQFRERTIAIAKGEIQPSPNEPKVFFESLQAFAQALSKANLSLLRDIQLRPGRSISELAKDSGRAQGNLSRTLKMFEGYGIITFDRKGREKIPAVQFDSIEPAPISLA